MQQLVQKNNKFGNLIATKGDMFFYFKKEQNVYGQIGNYYEDNIQKVEMLKGMLTIVTGDKIQHLHVCLRTDPEYFNNANWILYNFTDKLKQGAGNC